jgi:hypothetical protein
MLVEYRIKYHDDGVTISQRIEMGIAVVEDKDLDQLVNAVTLPPTAAQALGAHAGGGPQDRSGGGPQDRSGGGPQDRSGGGPQDRSGGGPQDRSGGGPQDRSGGAGGTDRSPVVILGPVIIRGGLGSLDHG